MSRLILFSVEDADCVSAGRAASVARLSRPDHARGWPTRLRRPAGRPQWHAAVVRLCASRRRSLSHCRKFLPPGSIDSARNGILRSSRRPEGIMDNVTIPALQAMKRAGQKIVGVVAWDFQIAQIVDRAGVDIVSVGDSVGINLWGHANPLEVTMDEMVVVCRAVRRGVKRALVSCDFP